MSMKTIKEKKYYNCSELFCQDSYNGNRQHFCKKKECRKASKADSQLGLISNITDIALQDDMAITFGRLLQLGLDIINPSTLSKGENHGIKTAHLASTGPAGNQTVQLA